MGVDYRAILAVGKEFDDKYEVEEFVRKHFTLTAEQEEILEDDGITEMFYNREDDIQCQCLNCYTGCGYYLGFKLNPRNVERFAESVSDAVNKWDALFPNHPAEIIHTVSVS